MPILTHTVFSEYELREMAVKFNNESGSTFVHADCVGTSEQEMEVRVITKKCRGNVVKERVKPTGKGTLKLKMHLPWDIYVKMFGMQNAKLVDGVMGYGIKSVHGEMTVVQHVFDEDGNEMFKAYPKCVVSTGNVSKIENGAEEVAEVELELALSTDEYGFSMYQALASELGESTLKNTWLTNWTSALMQKASV